MQDTLATLAAIGALGVGAQWLAWRLQVPAIVVMLAAGLAVGPGLQILDPRAVLDDLMRPILAIAVAVILFEGGLPLRFRQLADAAPAVKRMVLIGAPLTWALSSAAAWGVAGLSPAVAATFGGIMVITGPTTVLPMLRQARLAPRPAAILRWEAIIHNPIGALFAVLAFEIGVVGVMGNETIETALRISLGVGVATAMGSAAGAALAWVFRHGQAPEYLRAPILIASVLGVYVLANAVLSESGLVAVTVLGVWLANAQLPAFDELRRFKEQLTAMLVGGVFVILGADLNRETIASLDWSAAAFVVTVLFLVRPLAVLPALAWSGVPWREKALIAWIAPRGLVGFAVAGFFGAHFVDLGWEDGARLAPLAFALVATTVLAHGFSVRPLARLLGLVATGRPGVMIVGGSPWSAAFAVALREAETPVLVTDRDWRRLRPAREASVPVYYGEILGDAATRSLDFTRYATLVAASRESGYNALVCANYRPFFGQNGVFEIGQGAAEEDPRALPSGLGGKRLGAGLDFATLETRQREGWSFVWTTLRPEFGLPDYLRESPDADVFAVRRADGRLALVADPAALKAEPGDALLAFRPPRIAPGTEPSAARRSPAA